MAGNETYSGEHITPKGSVRELIIHSPEVHLGMNASDQIVKIRKLTSEGEIFERQITDSDITDYDVDRWVIYSAWGKVR